MSKTFCRKTAIRHGIFDFSVKKATSFQHFQQARCRKLSFALKTTFPIFDRDLTVLRDFKNGGDSRIRRHICPCFSHILVRIKYDTLLYHPDFLCIYNKLSAFFMLIAWRIRPMACALLLVAILRSVLLAGSSGSVGHTRTVA